jgi:hypothetical protein
VPVLLLLFLGFSLRLSLSSLADRAADTHLGGDLYGVVSAILSMPLPSYLIPGLRARAQLFVNAGNLVASQNCACLSLSLSVSVRYIR